MESENIKKLIMDASPDGRIPCAAAFQVAREAGVPVKVIGQIINELGIKITRCQLGCF